MGCRIGMATDVRSRVAALKAAGRVPDRATYRTVSRNLTYKEANELENRMRTQCGSHCQGSPGGGFKPRRVWNVYRIDW